MTVELPDDLLTPAAVADPAGAAAVLRTLDPVHWSPTHRAWLVSRYDDVVASFRNPALSSDRVRPLMSAQRERPSAEHRVLGLISEWMVVTDPPAHTRLRRLAGAAFKQQQIAAMEQRIQTLVDELVDAFLAGGPRGDLVAGVAYPLPAIVIAEMLGAPPEDRDRFRGWSDELALVAFGAGGDARPDRHERALRGLEEMAAYFRELVAARRAAPAGDMLSAMIAGDTPSGGIEEHGLTDDELVGMCALLLFAGHETTTNSIANAVRLLTADPALRDRVRDDPALVAPAVEESLRLAGPIKVLVRWVVADHELRGRTIRAGERVYLLLCGANRDPERFGDPDAVDLARERATHVAFGRGIHACIGAQLARLETRIAVGTLLRRLPGLRVDGDPAWLPTLASRAQESLPVVHDGVAAVDSASAP
ncbi:MAG: Putative cytochrome P450 hydroxylase [uncultured Actinomycetospora sp.]|uniref:Cytochrome P450 hydroxylase n=1 Tax=uncultured Actinomycetospora sp. TaxID=1135996 RepID=A0A6J4HEJ7_9PSEU|nr:MAG: Putative cytochrome P450 hydroxylase [uncultured Actinomycetospora sp.]